MIFQTKCAINKNIASRNKPIHSRKLAVNLGELICFLSIIKKRSEKNWAEEVDDSLKLVRAAALEPATDASKESLSKPCRADSITYAHMTPSQTGQHHLSRRLTYRLIYSAVIHHFKLHLFHHRARDVIRRRDGSSPAGEGRFQRCEQ